MASYEPATITTLSRVYTYLEDMGVSAWYGEAGKDIDLAKLILDTGDAKQAYAYCVEYGYITEGEDDE